MAYPVCGPCMSSPDTCQACWGLCSCELCKDSHSHTQVSDAGRAYSAAARLIAMTGMAPAYVPGDEL